MHMTHNNLIVWQARFSLGIPVIDREHMKLVRICNNLYKAILSAKTKDESSRKDAIKHALRECNAYAQTVFKHEDRLMQMCNFHGIEKHRNEHKMFLERVLKEINHFSKESFSQSLEFVRFLYDWILHHIAHVDTLYVKTFKDWHEKNAKEIKTESRPTFAPSVEKKESLNEENQKSTAENAGIVGSETFYSDGKSFEKAKIVNRIRKTEETGVKIKLPKPAILKNENEDVQSKMNIELNSEISFRLEKASQTLKISKNEIIECALEFYLRELQKTMKRLEYPNQSTALAAAAQ